MKVETNPGELDWLGERTNFEDLLIIDVKRIHYKQIILCLITSFDNLFWKFFYEKNKNKNFDVLFIILSYNWSWNMLNNLTKQILKKLGVLNYKSIWFIKMLDLALRIFAK